MNFGEYVIFLASIGNTIWFLHEWQIGKFLYWLGASILTFGIIKLRG